MCECDKLRLKKHAQITLFVIIAIVIISGVIGYFLLRDNIAPTRIPVELEPVYQYYTSCIEGDVINGAKLLGSQGGYIEKPEFEPGSDYMPFSNQLSFLGYGIPYWYYVSGNNIVKEQVPTKEEMEEELEAYIEKRIYDCNFNDFFGRGYEVYSGEAEAKVTIRDNEIEVSINQPLNMSFGESRQVIANHRIKIESSLGRFYNLAKNIYDHERDSLFLENYGVDILRLYAPVDNVDLDCSPQTWFLRDIRAGLKEAIMTNTMEIKLRGSYYGLAREENKYFVQDIGEEVGATGEKINFLYLEEFPFKMEVQPSENDMLTAEPLGIQPELGAMGFCFISYHFVYDIAYPVLIQIYTGDELFQFPVAVVLDKNIPIQERMNATGYVDLFPEICREDRRLTEMEVYTYNSNLEPVEANISFKCFSTRCSIGNTRILGEDSLLINRFPQCANATIIARAEGYMDKRVYADTINSGVVDIMMDKKYQLDLEAGINGRVLGRSEAVINFESEGNSFSLVYPYQTKVNLSAGLYNISVLGYEEANINFAGASTRRCIDVPTEGIGVIVGATEKNCFNFDVPGQVISYALSAGGKTTYYIAEGDLENADKILIQATDLGIPQNLEELSSNYDQVEQEDLEISFV